MGAFFPMFILLLPRGRISFRRYVVVKCHIFCCDGGSVVLDRGSIYQYYKAKNPEITNLKVLQFLMITYLAKNKKEHKSGLGLS